MTLKSNNTTLNRPPQRRNGSFDQ